MNKKGYLVLFALCVLIAGLALFAFGPSLGRLLPYGIFLLCPLMHVFMMFGHGSHDRQGSCHGSGQAEPKEKPATQR